MKCVYNAEKSQNVTRKRGESMEFIPCKAYLRAKGIEPGGNDIEYIEGYEYGL